MNAVHAASELDHDYCERFKETVPVDERIAACNRILDDPKEPSPAIANAYLARCQLWYTKQEHGRAVADCNAAIGRYPRFAPSYSVRGNIFHAQNNLERAIEDHTKAIELDPKWAPAYLYRAMAYDLQEKYDRAIADYSKAIEEDSNLIEAHRGRAAAYRQASDFTRAIAGYTDALRIDPQNEQSYFGRGLAYFYAKATQEALTDLRKANGLDPKDPYTVLWLHLVTKRDNVSNELSKVASQIDLTTWPAPLIRLYLGEMTAAQVLAAAEPRNKGQICEANFYIAEMALQAGKPEEAVRQFEIAIANCPSGYIELEAARHELKLLRR
jgi:lipoprotein NlpI